VAEAENKMQILAVPTIQDCREFYNDETKSNFPRSLMVSFIKAYRYWLSPLLPASCRFYPSCSAYALESYQRLGFWKGTYLSLCRILKCNPFHPGGIDPVPGNSDSSAAHYTEISERK
jgi:putative membrane protein insertion efficiency factor